MQVIPIKTSRVEPSNGIALRDWIEQNLRRQKQSLQDGDILVLSSKIVSYFEKGVVDLESIHPTKKSIETAKKMNDADPRLIQLAINEADEVVSETPWVLLTRKNGIYSANAGVDTSNVPKGSAVVWPRDPFGSARKLQKILRCPVVIIDSTCIPGRKGTTAVAIGYAGIPGMQDLKGSKDLYGNTLRYSALNIVDSLATAANLIMGESSESCPMAIIRGYRFKPMKSTKKGEMMIAPSEDLYQI